MSALLREWLGSVMCHCGNMRMGQMPNKMQHRNELWLRNSLASSAMDGTNLSITCLMLYQLSYANHLSIDILFFFLTHFLWWNVKEGDYSHEEEGFVTWAIFLIWVEWFSNMIQSYVIFFFFTISQVIFHHLPEWAVFLMGTTIFGGMPQKSDPHLWIH